MLNNEKETPWYQDETMWASIISCMLGLFLGISSAVDATRSHIQKEAVKAGVATYEADSDGNSVFTWKKIKN